MPHKIYPEDFYFSSLQPTTVWSKTPKQGPFWQIDINKSIRMSKPYWKATSRSSTSKKKKKILLSDFTRLTPDTAKFHQYRYWVNELFSAGFEIVLMDAANHPVTVSQDCWNNDAWCRRVLPQSQVLRKEIIQKKLLQKGENIDHYLILDHFENEKILNNNPSFHYAVELKSSQLLDKHLKDVLRIEQVEKIVLQLDSALEEKQLLGSPLPFERIPTCIIKGNNREVMALPPVKNLILDNIHNNILSALPTQLESIQLSDCSRLETIENVPEQLQKLILNTKKPVRIDGLNRLAKLKEVVLSQNENISDLSYLPKITKLSFKNDKEIMPDLCELQQLEEVDIDTTSKTNLSKLPLTIKKAKKLRLPSDFDLSKTQLVDLELNWIDGHITTLNLSPTLKKLKLYSGYEKIPDLHESELEELNLEGDFLTSIPQLPRTLKKLKLNNPFENRLTLPDLSMIPLEEIDLTVEHIQIKKESLPASLRTFNLSCADVTGIEEFDFSDTRLEEIRLQNMVLKKMPQFPVGLKKLFLTVSSHDLKLDFSGIPLEELELNASEVKSTELDDMILKIPVTLKKLKGVKCRKLPDLNEAQLEELELNDIYSIEITKLPVGLKKLKLTELYDGKLPDLSNTSLTELIISEDYSLKEIGKLPPTLTKLKLDSHSLKELPDLSKTQVEELDLDCFDLNVLPKLPPTIKKIKIKSYFIDELPDLSDTQLEELELDCSSLEKLPSLPPTLKRLKVKAYLKELPDLFQTQLETLELDTFSLRELPPLPLTLKEFIVKSHFLEKLPDLSQLTLESWDIQVGEERISQRQDSMSEAKPFTVSSDGPSASSSQPRVSEAAAHSGESFSELQLQPVPTKSESLDSKHQTVSKQIKKSTENFSMDLPTKTDPTKTLEQSYTIYRNHLKPIFPSQYRHHISDTVLLDKEHNISLGTSSDYKEDKALVEKILQTEDLFQKNELNHLAPNQYFVQYPMKLPLRQWVPLPGLFAGDVIAKMFKPAGCHIRYHAIHHQYEMYLTEPSEQPLQYIAIEKKNNIALSQPENDLLPAEVRDLLDSFILQDHKKYSIKNYPAYYALQSRIKTLIQGNATFDEKLRFCQKELVDYFDFTDEDAISQLTEGLDPCLRIVLERKGACVQRAFAYTILCQYLGITARFIGNDLHGFAEIYNGREWQTIDLGGTAAQIKNHSPSVKFGSGQWDGYFSPKKTIDPAQFKQEADVITWLTKQTEPLVVPIDNLAAGRNLYAAIAIKAKNSIYIESQEDLEALLTLIHVNERGEIQKIPGPLHTLLEKGGLLVVQWDNFSATEIASLKSLMDKPPTLSGYGKPISNQFRLINLVTPKTSCGPTFYSRAKQFCWPTHIAFPKDSLPPEKNAETSYTIDLYGSADWEKVLLGEVTLTDKGFAYRSGALQKALKAGYKKIRLIDTHRDSRSFQYFIHCLLVKHGCRINGEKITIPPDFSIEYDIPLATSKPDAIRDLTPDVDNKKADVFYLNQSTFHLLFEQTMIQGGKISTRPGWLASPDKMKIIVQTGPLTEGAMRQIYSAINTKSNQCPLYWQDLTKEPAKKPAEMQKINIQALSSSGNCLIETPDPHFIAQLLQEEKAASVLISAQTDTGTLLESVTEAGLNKTKNLREMRFTQKIQEVAKKLLAGETVILYGQLSHELYSSLEPLLANPPQLKLSTHEKATIPLGKLIIVTSPCSFPTVLPQHNKNAFMISHDAIIKAYREKISEKDYVLFDKIIEFYRIAGIIPHGHIGMPTVPFFTFERLLTMLDVLKNKSKSVSFKSLFHYDYEKESEEYAHLNVIAKQLFDDLEEKPCVRLYKINQYPNTEAYRWRRADCFNGAALKSIDCEKEQPVIDFLDHFNKNKMDYQFIQKNTNPQEKLACRLDEYLTRGNGVVLKGPPGSGKTFLALAYKDHPTRCAYFGEEAIHNFLSSRPLPGKESVLILDEANLAVPGYWDYLAPLFTHHQNGEPIQVTFLGKTFTVSNRHKVIFTCNPESYAGRDYHPIMQNLPTLYINTWTHETLKKYVLQPLVKQLDAHLRVSERELHQIIDVYELAKQSFPAGTVSIRDLNQLVCRWMYYIKQGMPSKEALYQACLAEWSNGFESETEKESYHVALSQTLQRSSQLTFKPNTLSLSYLTFKTATPILNKRPKGYFLCHTLRSLLAVIHEDMVLAKTWQSKSTLDHAPLVKVGVLIEGDSGMGKSASLRMLLKAMEYKEYKGNDILNPRITNLNNTFIQFTVSGNLEQDAEILRAAFDKGCKVILDELNLGPDLEGLLNHLLTGHTPEGHFAKQPGFFIFASQNDQSTLGTLPVSKALTNRLHVYRPSPYTKTDLMEFTEEALPGFSLQYRTAIVDSYQRQKEKNPNSVNTRTFLEGLATIRTHFPRACDINLARKSTVTPALFHPKYEDRQVDRSCFINEPFLGGL